MRGWAGGTRPPTPADHKDVQGQRPTYFKRDAEKSYRLKWFLLFIGLAGSEPEKEPSILGFEAEETELPLMDVDFVELQELFNKSVEVRQTYDNVSKLVEL